MKLREFIDSTKQLLVMGVFETDPSHLNSAFLELCDACDKTRFVNGEELLPAVYFYQSKVALGIGSLTPQRAWDILYTDLRDKPNWGYKDQLRERLKEHFETTEYSDEFKGLWLTVFAEANAPVESKYAELNTFIEDLPVDAIYGAPAAPHDVYQEARQPRFLLREPSEFITIPVDQHLPHNDFHPTPDYSFLFNAFVAVSLATCVISLSIVVLALTSVITLSAPIIAATGLQATLSAAAAYIFFKRPASCSNNDVDNLQEFVPS